MFVYILAGQYVQPVQVQEEGTGQSGGSDDALYRSAAQFIVDVRPAVGVVAAALTQQLQRRQRRGLCRRHPRPHAPVESGRAVGDAVTSSASTHSYDS